MFLSHLNISRKLSAAFAVLIVMTVACNTMVYLQLRSIEANLHAAGFEKALKVINTADVVLIIAALASVGVAAMLAAALSRQIAQPVISLTSAMRKLADGDQAVAIPGADREDEIGAMAGAVQVFKDAAAEKSRLEVASSETAREKARIVEVVAAGMSRLAAGDLTSNINESFPAEYEKLRQDFNTAADQLREAMKVIVVNAEGITSGANEISQAADDLSQRTEQQAATLEQTAAALDQITATVRRTAEGAAQANGAVLTARDDAEKSGEVVRHAVAAMNGIEKSAGEISQIIGVIDEIAFQTNLLALNAGVEAARAGDAGRGFAVVASEVRALAQRSAEAAREIKDLISTSTNQVKEGVDLVGRTGEALERIVKQVSGITGLVSEIAASAKEQAVALVEVNTAVNQMDQMTQQNAAMVEESTAASHSLAHEAAELAGLVSRFQIGARTQRPAPAAPIQRPASAAPARASARAPARAAAPAPTPKPAHGAPIAEAKPGVHKPGPDTLHRARARVAAFAGAQATAAKHDDWQEF
jgi:methyl-accepting chemotaxis protein